MRWNPPLISVSALSSYSQHRREPSTNSIIFHLKYFQKSTNIQFFQSGLVLERAAAVEFFTRCFFFERVKLSPSFYWDGCRNLTEGKTCSDLSAAQTVLGGFRDILMIDEQLESFILQKNTHLMVPALQKSRIPFFLYHWNIWAFFDSLCSNKLDSMTSSWCSGDCDELCSTLLSDILKSKQPTDYIQKI